MAQILIITDRPREDERVAAFAAEVGHQLNVDGLAAVVALNGHLVLPTSLVLGTLDGGLLPQTMPLSITTGGTDMVATRRLFAACHQSAAFYGLKCETARASVSLPCTAVSLADYYSLLVLSRDTLLQEANNQTPLQILSSEVAAPLMICPSVPQPWRRIVVAARNDASRDQLLAWGQHWSALFDVPLTVIGLSSLPFRSAWSALTCWKPWTSRTCRQQAIRQQLLAYDFGTSDLLLVDRQPALWRFCAASCEISLENLVAATNCTIGVAPTTDGGGTQQILYPLESENAA